MYTLKSIAQRGTMLGAAVALVAAAVIPSVSVMAAELNPLTERSLLLSSSAPGWQDTDGSGFSETSPNPVGQYYAAPGSGPNGKKTGETFSFRVSTNSAATSTPIKGFTLQYCTTAAGVCIAPGNNAGDADVNDDGDTSDSTRVTNAVGHAAQTSDFEAVLDTAVAGTDFTVKTTDNTQTTTDQSTGWAVATSNVEDHVDKDNVAVGVAQTGKDNMISLTHATGISPVFNDKIELKFNASSSNYLTNPGADEFFVKINTYSSDTVLNETTLIDGGVTVANVMTDSIHITTKVLETMSFSVGTQNPDTQNVQHGSCDVMTAVNNNRIDLGDRLAENSLKTSQAYDAFSYWRLSSNSSGGATVYYSGDTLKSTVGDEIATMGTPGATPAAAYSQPGTEQFGLSLMAASGSEDVIDTAHAGGFPSNWVAPAITPLNPVAHYNGGGYNGAALYPISNATSSENGMFYFDANSTQVPELIAQNNNQVLSCATAKMRYVANIAADTPAGVYTTKINYLAAPQY